MTSLELVVPGTGELIDLNSENDCAAALTRIDELTGQLREAKREVVYAVQQISERALSKTLMLADGSRLVLTAGFETVYDADEIRADLLAAGIDESVVDGIVVMQPVVYKVNAARAKSAGAVNPAVQAIIGRHTRKVEKPVYASVKR